MKFLQLHLGLASLAVVLMYSPAATASIQLYTGSLTSADGGIVANGQWLTPGPTTLDWTISDNEDGTINYKYIFAHPDGETSHLLLEISTNVTSLTDPDLQFENLGDGTPLLGTFGSEGNSNPGIPGDLYSIKFDATEGLTTTIEFNIARLPVWGDFYSKDGKAGGADNYAYNSGFLAADPTDPPADGPLLGHLLVPDSLPPVGGAVPEPVSVVVWSMILCGCLATSRGCSRRTA